MAKKAKTNLSQAVREFFTANPEASAKEVIAGLAEKGLTINAGLVYAVKGSMNEKKRRKKRLAKAALATTNANNSVTAKTDAITMVREVKALAQKSGGYAKLMELVKALSE